MRGYSSYLNRTKKRNPFRKFNFFFGFVLVMVLGFWTLLGVGGFFILTNPEMVGEFIADILGPTLEMINK